MLDPALCDVLIQTLLDRLKGIFREIRFELIPSNSLALPHPKHETLSILLIGRQFVLLINR
jgi:hypothetical protein